MRGHETFDHTADIGIRAWGSEFSQVFEEAAKALFSVMVDLKTVSPRQKLKIELTKDSGEELFLSWLKELLFIFESRRLLLCEFKILVIPPSPFPPKSSPGLNLGYLPEGREGKGEGMSALGPVSLTAEASGEVLNNKKHALGREVKAITLHQFKLVKDKGRYLAEVILDI